MGQLVVIAGNLGVGKTTLTQKLSTQLPAVPYWEEPEKHPFQTQFYRDPARWTLTNQIDFLIFRAEQENIIRHSAGIGIQDGGLDQDFHLFTRYLQETNRLTTAEFQLCERIYRLIRDQLPPPELILYIQTPFDVLLYRRTLRGRDTDTQMVTIEQLHKMEQYLEDWIINQKKSKVIRLCSDQTDDLFEKILPEMAKQVSKALHI